MQVNQNSQKGDCAPASRMPRTARSAATALRARVFHIFGIPHRTGLPRCCRIMVNNLLMQNKAPPPPAASWLTDSWALGSFGALRFALHRMMDVADRTRYR